MAEQDPTSPVTPAAPSNEQAPVDQAAPPVQPAEQKPKINLQEVPEFKNWQTQVNETMRRQAAEYSARIIDLENRVVSYEESGLDDFEKAQRHNYRLQQQIAALHQQEQQRLTQAAEQQAIMGDMQRISKHTGIPVQELFSCATLEDAEAKGVEYLKKSLLAEQKDETKKTKAHLPDAGGGRSSADSQILAKVNAAGDLRDIAALYAQALGGSST